MRQLISPIISASLASRSIIFKGIFTAAVIASSAIAGTAFASGYGSAPYYDALAGEPASQRRVSAQTVAIESVFTDFNASGYGGSADTVSQAGARTTGTVGTSSLLLTTESETHDINTQADAILITAKTHPLSGRLNPPWALVIVPTGLAVFFRA